MADFQLLHGDCLDIIPTLKGIDAVVTDPPYGIGINKSHRLSTSRGFAGQTWDERRAEREVKLILDLFGDKPVTLWGGNYYTDILPPSRGWLIWDKRNAGRDFGEAELAWTNKDDVIRTFFMRPQNMDGGKVHPTQKPVDLMIWNLKYLDLPAGATILDPFAGSGSTGVAALAQGYNVVLIEREKRHHDTALDRLKTAKADGVRVQHELFAGAVAL